LLFVELYVVRGCIHQNLIVILDALGIYPLRFKQQAKHIDGNIFNNSLNNLKW